MSEDRAIFLPTTHGGLTNWYAYGLPEIWQMVQSESSYPTWEQHDAWRRMALLCEDQAKMLTNAVAELQRHWPARPGSASEAFGSIVNGFVAAMRQSAADALTNRDTVGNIVVDIGTTRARIAELVDRHNRYEAAERAFLPQPTPSPGQSVPPPPTEGDRPPENWRTMLDIEARRIMVTNDAKVGTEAQRFAANPFTGGSDRGKVVDPNEGGPILPAGASSPIIPMPAFDPPPLRSPSGASSSVDYGSGASVDPDGEGEVVLEGSPITTGQPGIAGQPGIGSMPGGPSTWTSADALGSGRSHSGLGAPGQFPGVAVIGRTAAGGTMPPQVTTNSTSATPYRTGQSVGSPMPPMMGAPMAQPGQRGGGVTPGGHTPGYRDRNRRRDPDDPWGTKEGNPAVIEPPAEPGEHTPGPGVLGLDR